MLRRYAFAFKVMTLSLSAAAGWHVLPYAYQSSVPVALKLASSKVSSGSAGCCVLKLNHQHKHPIARPHPACAIDIFHASAMTAPAFTASQDVFMQRSGRLHNNPATLSYRCKRSANKLQSAPCCRCKDHLLAAFRLPHQR